MIRIALILALSITSTLVHAQISFNINAGVNRPLIKDGHGGMSNATLKEVTVTPSFLGSANLMLDKPKVVNLGIGLSLKGNSIDSRLSYTNDYVKIPRVDISHQSLFVSIHPVIDVNVDKNRYFHFLINPNFYLLVWGKENGYSRGYLNTLYTYDNSAKQIKKFVLGFNAQTQVRYPITKQLKAVATVGYSINNSPSGFIPSESGNVFGQLGVIFHIGYSFPGKEGDKKENQE